MSLLTFYICVDYLISSFELRPVVTISTLNVAAPGKGAADSAASVILSIYLSIIVRELLH